MNFTQVLSEYIILAKGLSDYKKIFILKRFSTNHFIKRAPSAENTM